MVRIRVCIPTKNLFFFLVSVLFSITSTKTHGSELEKSFEISYKNSHQIATESTLTVTNFVQNDQNLSKTPRKRKEWTFITYMAADNDLAPFARKNLKQQADVGSNSRINIVTQLDTRVAGNKKVTKRYYIEKDKLIVTNHNDPSSQKMDSGLPQTLIDCCKWAIENYPAENYALVLWNHGTGAIDVSPRRSINPSPLFMFNPESNLLELDRSIPFIDYIQAAYSNEHRAICFDDSTGHFLNNQDLEMALETIQSKLLNGRKFSIICFDACLMSMIEIANIVKKYADYMDASQEVELGAGYNYYKILIPFEQRSLTKELFAKHIISSYKEAYQSITNDYTQSALKLDSIYLLEFNINQVAELLIEALKGQNNSTVKETIRMCRHKMNCTHFDEPSYLDLHHLYKNLLNNLVKFTFINGEQGRRINNQLHMLLNEGMQIIEKIVIANTAGKNLSQAHGISIYFPEKKLNASYQKTNFAKTNKWFDFIKTYLTT